VAGRIKKIGGKKSTSSGQHFVNCPNFGRYNGREIKTAK
jgi:hypothetical protein